MNRWIFDTFSASETTWLSFDKQVAPIPKPAAACFGMLASLLAAPALRRSVKTRARPVPPPSA